MNCKKYEDLLLTDYIDGVLDTSKQKDCDSHLKQCAKCQEMVRDIKVLRQTTFGEAPELRPAAHVWERISQKIQPSPSWLEEALSAFTFPRLVFTVPTLALVVLLLFVVISFPGANGSYDLARIYLIQQLTGTEDVMGAGNVSGEEFGSVIEEYFM